MLEFVDEKIYKSDIGVYRIVNNINGHVYVGQTKERFQRRYWLHRWELRNGRHDNTYLQRAWNKYGEGNFSFEVIEVLPENEIDNREIYWISYYRNNGGCYSIQDGGQPKMLSQYISQEARKRVGEMNKKRMTGSKLSDETKAKMSVARKGKHPVRKNDILTSDEAALIKRLLVSGMTSGQIVKETGLSYKGINSIISNNNYSAIKVDGWDEYYEGRQKSVKHRLSDEQIDNLVKDVVNGMSNSDAAKKYGIGECSVRRHVRLRK